MFIILLYKKNNLHFTIFFYLCNTLNSQIFSKDDLATCDATTLWATATNFNSMQEEKGIKS